MFSWIKFLDRRNRVLGTQRPSAMHSFTTSGSWQGSPGGAWIASLDYIEKAGGFVFSNIVGGGDQSWLAHAADGKSMGYLRVTSPKHADDERQWVENAIEAKGSTEATVIDGGVFHLWHGDRVNRQHQTRYQILVRHDYDPTADLRIASNGLITWRSNKPQLREEVRDYFMSRKEDG